MFAVILIQKIISFTKISLKNFQFHLSPELQPHIIVRYLPDHISMKRSLILGLLSYFGTVLFCLDFQQLRQRLQVNQWKQLISHTIKNYIIFSISQRLEDDSTITNCSQETMSNLQVSF